MLLGLVSQVKLTLRNTLFLHAVTSFLSQRLLHKKTNSRQFWEFVFTFVKRWELAKNSILTVASILADTLVRYICRNIIGAQGKRSLHWRWSFISTFAELHGHGDECWPTEVTWYVQYFRGVRIARMLSPAAFCLSEQFHRSPRAGWDWSVVSQAIPDYYYSSLCHIHLWTNIVRITRKNPGERE